MKDFLGSKANLDRRGPVLGIIFGLIFLCLGIGNSIGNYLYRTQGVEVVGTVVGKGSCQTGEASNGPDLDSLEYEFKLPNGRQVRGVTCGYSENKSETVLIEYLPLHPSSNRISGSGAWDQKFLAPVAIAGFVLIVICIYSLVLIQRTKSGQTNLEP